MSSGKDNSELVDNLCYEDYIQTPCVERVFRMIDRADYMLFRDDEDRLEAYEDHAWRRGTLHLSAPCIYTRALEALKLERSVSFLNIGSGTGYFSTMAGMLIGPFGINHGIELYPENVEYAHEKLQEFKESSRWYNPTEFCEPVFIVGNGLLLSPGNILYDRIYCGAGCPPEHAQLMKNMLNVGGILVMPHDNQVCEREGREGGRGGGIFHDENVCGVIKLSPLTPHTSLVILIRTCTSWHLRSWLMQSH